MHSVLDRVEWPLSIATPCHHRLSPRHCCCDAAFHLFTSPFTAALLLRDAAFHRLYTAALPLRSQGHRGRVPVGLFLRGARVPRVRPADLTDTPSPSLLTHLLQGEGGAARMTEFSSTAARFGSERLVSVKSQVRPQGRAGFFWSIERCLSSRTPHGRAGFLRLNTSALASLKPLPVSFFSTTVPFFSTTTVPFFSTPAPFFSL